MNPQGWTRAGWFNTATIGERAGQRPDLFHAQEMVGTLQGSSWCASAKRAWTWVNAKLAEYLRPTKSNLLFCLDNPGDHRKSQQTLLHPRGSAGAPEAWQESIRMDGRHEGRSADQSNRRSLFGAEPIRHHEGNVFSGLARNVDIDDPYRTNETRRDLSKQLPRAGQIVPLAAMSASIAHEINQPLGAIVANAHAASTWLEANPPNVSRAKVLIDRILRDSRVAADVVQKTLGLLKQQPPVKQIIGLPHIVNQVLTILEPEIQKHKVEIITGIPAGLPRLFADSVQIQQVLINLIGNAIDAVHEASALDRRIWLEAEPEGNIMAVRVRDTGHGVPDPNLIFETFFTTKTNGVGIGLAVSRSIAEAHDGSLTVRNGPDRGAEFTLRVPCVSDRLSRAG
jgi:C4-dicarboxylate-specific signal transduction histidine kinase